MEQKSLQYNLVSVKKLTAYLNSLDALPIKDLKDEKIGVRKGFQFRFDKISGIFNIRLIVDFMCRVETPEPIKLFGVTVQFEFSFKDYNEIIQEVDNTKVNIPDDLLITLMSVSYSTTRGILSMFTDGTDYQDVLLPLVNIQEFKAMLLPQQV